MTDKEQWELMKWCAVVEQRDELIRSLVERLEEGEIIAGAAVSTLHDTDPLAVRWRSYRAKWGGGM